MPTNVSLARIIVMIAIPHIVWNVNLGTIKMVVFAMHRRLIIVWFIREQLRIMVDVKYAKVDILFISDHVTHVLAANCVLCSFYA